MMEGSMKPCLIRLSQVRSGYGANGDRPVLANANNIRYVADAGGTRQVFFGHEGDDGGFIYVKETLDEIAALINGAVLETA
jgi:hypothetical protein